MNYYHNLITEKSWKFLQALRKKFVVSHEAFLVPEKEILAILKQKALMARAGSVKGRKDLIDLVGLFALGDFDWIKYGSLVKKYEAEDYLASTQKILLSTFKLEEIGLNVHSFSRLKRRILPFL